jgi:hypothetical protein
VNFEKREHAFGSHSTSDVDALQGFVAMENCDESVIYIGRVFQPLLNVTYEFLQLQQLGICTLFEVMGFVIRRKGRHTFLRQIFMTQLVVCAMSLVLLKRSVTFAHVQRRYAELVDRISHCSLHDRYAHDHGFGSALPACKVCGLRDVVVHGNIRTLWDPSSFGFHQCKRMMETQCIES